MLFLWFKDDWFCWQFAIVAAGFLAREFLRWTRDGVNTHMFWPPLADYRLVLRGSKGPVMNREPAQLYARACAQGWPDTCGTR